MMKESELKKINVQNIKDCDVENMSNFDFKNINIKELGDTFDFLEEQLTALKTIDHKTKDIIIVLYRHILKNLDFYKQYIARHILDTIDSHISKLDKILQEHDGEVFAAFRDELLFYSTQIKYLKDGFDMRE